MQQRNINISRLVEATSMSLHGDIKRETDPSIADIFWGIKLPFLYVTLTLDVNTKTLDK